MSVTLEQGRSETGFPGSLSFQRAFISLLSLQQWRADYLFKQQIPSLIISPGQILFKVISTVWRKANGRRSVLDPYSHTQDLHSYQGTCWPFFSHSSSFISVISFPPVLADLGKAIYPVTYSNQHRFNSSPWGVFKTQNNVQVLKSNSVISKLVLSQDTSEKDRGFQHGHNTVDHLRSTGTTSHSSAPWQHLTTEEMQNILAASAREGAGYPHPILSETPEGLTQDTTATAPPLKQDPGHARHTNPRHHFHSLKNQKK